MSQAFVREGDEQWLHDIAPTLSALINYLTNENNGVRIYVKRTYQHPTLNKEIHEMSNGLSYAIGDDSKWTIVD